MTAAHLLRDAVERFAPASLTERIWPDPEPEPTTIDLPFPATERMAIEFGKRWLEEARLYVAPWEPVVVHYVDVINGDQSVTVEPSRPAMCRCMPVPLTSDPAAENGPSENTTEEASVSEEARSISTGGIADGGAIDHPRAIKAIRRIVALMLTTSGFEVEYDKDSRTVQLVGLGAAPASMPVLTLGSTVVDWADTEAVKALLDRLETRGLEGLQEDNAIDALRRLEAIRADVAETQRHALTKPETVHSALNRIAELAEGVGLPDAEAARIDNVALRAEVDRLRHNVEIADKAQMDAKAETEAVEARLQTTRVRLHHIERHARTVATHLGDAWWAEAGESLAEIRKATCGDGSDEPQPEGRGPKVNIVIDDRSLAAGGQIRRGGRVPRPGGSGA